MSYRDYKGKSLIYKYVYIYESKGKRTYQGKIMMNKISKGGFECERKCAKWVDIQLIQMGKDPVNILTKKLA